MFCVMTDVVLTCISWLLWSVGSGGGSEAPTFIEPLYSLDVTEGEAACFTVTVSGRPSPRVTWLHNDAEVVEGRSPYFEVCHSSDGVHHSLRIGEVFADDAGTVRVTADNEAGSVSTSAKLTVTRQFYHYLSLWSISIITFSTSLLPSMHHAMLINFFSFRECCSGGVFIQCAVVCQHHGNIVNRSFC